MDGMRVTPAELRTAGGNIVDIASEIQRTASELSGQTSAVAAFGANGGFDTQAAARTLEGNWETAIDAIAARISLAGDTMDVNADTYASTEDANTDVFSHGLGA
ncbi:WXG100 family type VII secretion target [Actinophytocola gossypii]|uniref:WXG100 family type VII secretion target n=1 Tax=Actinophytocola gossypii TaxID=2812003 RepID=A0ABT2J843_9PSEU|nr:type VII secretion target [Actinophytocola gossypii]MCT2584025.1 hypothetical protein [Actinophytocola gossypii]